MSISRFASMVVLAAAAPQASEKSRISTRQACVVDPIGKVVRTGIVVGSRCAVREGPARVARVAVALCVLMLTVGSASAHAALLSEVSSFGSQGSGAGQFQTPLGVAIAPTSGFVYVADSGNARVQKFDVTGQFISAWGWGVTDGMARSEACTANCQAGIPGSGAGQFSNPTSIAATQSRVYVGDAGNNVVLVFDASGVFIATIDGTTTPHGHFSTVAGVAVDQSGNLWVADGNSDFISEFNSKNKFLQQWQDPFGQTVAIAVDATNNAVYLIRGAQTTERFTLTGGNETVIDMGTGVALGLDLQTGNLYVDHGGDVAIYDHTGTPIDSLTLATTNSQGLAFRVTGGKKSNQNSLYASDASANNVTIYGPPTTPGAPLVSGEAATSTGATSVTLKGTIVPLGLDTTCIFQYVDSVDFQLTGYTNATNVPCTPADLGSSFTYQQASADVSGLTVGTFYHFRAVATNSAGTTEGADMSFQAGPGLWTPYFRCPVDDPAMLATDGVNLLSSCVASNSTHGSITIGTTNSLTGNSNLQFGAVADFNTGVFTAVGSASGALVGDPVEVTAGGITVIATVESAGVPSDFDLSAGLGVGQPIVTLPVKIHLVGQTVDLGPSCFIGSEVDPIVLHPENTDTSGASLSFGTFDPDGTADPNGELLSLVVGGLVQGDDTFSVPGATGCGPNGDGSLDAAVNAVVGLPSPSGANHLVLDDASSSLGLPAFALSGTGTPLTGQQFANDWHVAFGFPTTTTSTTSTAP
jgi:DNA-binding beta-propeller fold protein YncE